MVAAMPARRPSSRSRLKWRSQAHALLQGCALDPELLFRRALARPRRRFGEFSQVFFIARATRPHPAFCTTSDGFICKAAPPLRPLQQ